MQRLMRWVVRIRSSYRDSTSVMTSSQGFGIVARAAMPISLSLMVLSSAHDIRAAMSEVVSSARRPFSPSRTPRSMEPYASRDGVPRLLPHAPPSRIVIKRWEYEKISSRI